MRIERISEFDRFLQLKNQWDLLHAGDDLRSPALTHQWFSSWISAFGKQSELAVLALFDGETLIGVAPLHIVTSRYRAIPCRQLRLLHNRHGPRCAFLLREGYASYTGALMEEVRKLRGWDVAIFEHVPVGSYLHSLCTELVDRRERSVLLRKTMSSPRLKIEGSWEDFLGSRSKNFRRSLRKKEKRLLAAGRMTIEHFTDAASGTAIMPTLIALGDKSWKAQNGRAIGSQPQSRTFYNLLAETFGRQNRVSVWLMKINGEPAAFEFHLVQGRHVQALRGEFSEDYRSLGVGSVLDKEIVKRLFEAGFEEYDMGGSEDFYKLRWTEDVTEHSEFLMFGKSVVGRLVCAIEKGAVEMLKKIVKRRKA